MKRRDPQLIGSVPAVTLTLSVLLCIGAMSDGSAAAAVVAQSLDRHATTASERESVATLLSNLNDAARKLCRVHTGQALSVTSTPIDLPLVHHPTALRAYQTDTHPHAGPDLLDLLLNLPPPATTL